METKKTPRGQSKRNCNIIRIIDNMVCNLNDKKYREKNNKKANIKGNNGTRIIVREKHYDELKKYLSQRIDPTCESKSAVILIGPRGSGKSHVLQRAFSDVKQEYSNKPFHVVKVNGISFEIGNDHVAIKEIIRQLTNIALESEESSLEDKIVVAPRQGSFHSHLSNLEEAFERAGVDSIPLFIVLEELEYFSFGKQSLLYHILDKACHYPYLTLIGVSTRMCVLDMFEKRVRSRALGNHAVIFFQHFEYTEMVNILLHKLDYTAPNDDDHLVVRHICEQIKEFLLPIKMNSYDNDDSIYSICIKNHRNGKSLRWFSRVLTVALSFLLEVSQYQEEPSMPTIVKIHLMEALSCMHGIFPSSPLQTQSQFSCDLNPRIQSILELSGPQVAMLLSARRILVRSASSDKEEISYSKNLSQVTFQHIQNEYESFVKKHSTIKYSTSILYNAFCSLLEFGVIHSISDHAGSKSNFSQFDYSRSRERQRDFRNISVDIDALLDKEIDIVLKYGWLDCSTGLRDWGMKIV